MLLRWIVFATVLLMAMNGPTMVSSNCLTHHKRMTNSQLHEGSSLWQSSPLSSTSKGPSCGQMGLCDSASVRDATPTWRQMRVNLTLHLMCDNAGKCPDRIGEAGYAIIMMNHLNLRYSPYNVSFVVSIIQHNGMIINEPYRRPFLYECIGDGVLHFVSLIRYTICTIYGWSR
jgi:hypothetical protein